MRERLAQLLRPGGGRRDDDLDVIVTDQAGTASRPPRVQRGQALGVEQVDHVPDGVLIGGDQPRDRRDQRARRRRHDDHRPPHPDRPVLPRRTICCSRRPSSSLSRRARTGSAIAPPATRLHHKIECGSHHGACQQTRSTFVVSALALQRRALPSPPLCRFIPALSHKPAMLPAPRLCALAPFPRAG